MYKDKFVLSIIHDGHPVKETGRNYDRKVAIPFDSEYKILLKNKNDRGCTAKVFIDGRPVSQLGDFIINSHDSLHLERFLDSSLKKGKKFKFVPSTHPDVDDPTSSQNGIIEVEFRLAKKPLNDLIKIQPIRVPPPSPEPRCPDIYYKKYSDWTYIPDSTTVPDFTTVWDWGNATASYMCSNMMDSDVNIADGATVEGGLSNQEFVYGHIEVESRCVTLRLKMVGISNENHERFNYIYCRKCGVQVKKKDKYCFNCGEKL